MPTTRVGNHGIHSLVSSGLDTAEWKQGFNAPTYLSDNPEDYLSGTPANDDSSGLETDKWGDEWHDRTDSDGSQTWSSALNGVIRNWRQEQQATSLGRSDRPEREQAQARRLQKKMRRYVMADAHSASVNMFLALDASWDEHNDDTLTGYLSDASPFTFVGKRSADPAVWSEFSSAFAARFPQGKARLKDAREFARDYLAGISDVCSRAYPGRVRLVDAFEEIAPLGRWVEAFEPQGAEG